ncbi:MAG: glutathione S-transferase family protein [Hydrogenophaga sp.]|uniref:glutathione S-transferase family protein n=1 Tax=Hydrogenophaga sp. TaxID=1904254 RepID=UPI00272F3EB0|nr:glutathione S-transferase family protein [Hydrogenophaga sp.]MDP2251755.1 glutathione S-transferase family protein [Hydrogenophaga sp.]MDZ4125239.1 glutathione S-transferase family protein [Hydrogenophaga sp.]MDZ4281947.1 glutathione S-transferase family protein [Hydrogenophaga sp.]
MIQLHSHPSDASMVPHIVLEELGVPYERVLVDKANGAHKAPDYLVLNPNGLIPVLVDGNLVLYETAAICLHLCDTHPNAGLLPTLGSAQRAHAYKWLVWLTNTLQATLIIYFYPQRWVNEGNAVGEAEVKAHAQARVGALLDQLDAELARHGGPWFMGAEYSVLDAYVFTLCRWTRNFSTAPARERAHLGPYLLRVLERPAVQRALANEGLAPPFV